MSLKKDNRKRNAFDEFKYEDLFDEEEREKLDKMNEIQKEIYIAEKRHK